MALRAVNCNFGVVMPLAGDRW